MALKFPMPIETIVAAGVLLLGPGVLAGTAHAADSGEEAWGEWGCGRMLEGAPTRGLGAFDEKTGADNRNWAPDPMVEWKHLRLEIDFVDFERGRFEALATYRIAPIGVPVTSLDLDANGLDVKWVRWGKGDPDAGGDLEHFHDGSKLGIRFPAPLRSGESEVAIRYSGEQPVQGLVFTPPCESGSPEVHSQGQAESNHYWFPCHDFPNVRVAVDLLATVPKGLAVSGNGAFVEKRDAPVGGVTGAVDPGGAGESAAPREVWHWRQEKPIVPYLISIVAGRFAQVPLDSSRSGVSMKVWVPPEREADVARTFGHTDEMIALFERVFGQKYPWARYDQLVVRNFGAGGMENVAATTLHPAAIFDEIAGAEEDLDGLIAHELCHQWTGDLVTCRTWAHIWLNEGWATYGSALWMEHRDGEDGYFDSIYGSNGVAKRDSTDGATAMVSPIYRNPWEVFGRAPNPYPKGASILHMLREKLGEEVFSDGVHRYMAAHAGGLAETDDFRKALEAASGRSLEWFFDQWCYRPGCPRLKADVGYDAESRTLTVRVEQTQKIDERTPAFRLDLPIVVETVSGARTIPWEIRDRVAEKSIELDGPPQLVAIDPRLASLKTLETNLSTGLLAECARRGPTQAARRFAIEALSRKNEPESIAVLGEIAASTGAARSSRREAIEALAGFDTPEARAKVIAIFDAAEADPRVRATLVDALAKQPKEDVAERLERTALHDRSYQCRAGAARALGALKATDRVEALVALAAVPSHQERIRVAAIGALAALEDARGIEPALALAKRGNFDRARPDAIEALGRLGKKAEAAQREKIVKELLALLDDPERRSRDAAGDALAELKASEATEKLQAIASSDRDPGRRERAERWLKSIRGDAPARTP